MSYLDISRKTADGEDGFEIKIRHPVKFVSVTADPGSKQKEDSKIVTKMNWFAQRHAELTSSDIIQPCFRMKFERAQTVTKVQKPYAITSIPLQLKPGVPLKVGTDRNN